MKLSSELDGKSIVITGGAGLIGKGFAEAVANSGGTVVIADIDDVAGEKARQDIATTAGADRVRFINVDITSEESLRDMIELVTREHGGIDALVNNAYPRNANYGRDFEDVTYRDFCENVNLHLGGYFLASQQVARHMVERKSGVIINIASIYGFMAPRFELYAEANFTSPVEYSAIKGGLLSLTKYLASYLGQHGIRVNAISPGGVYNQQAESFVKQYARKTVIGHRMAELGDLTGALVFLLSDASKYITGQNIVVDGGWSI